MLKGGRSALPRLSLDTLASVLIFVSTLLIFWLSPVHQITDSHYSMLLSESLLKHQSFTLDNFNLPRLEPNVNTRDYYVMNGNIWQLELARGHIYYYFPPGSSILSVSYVAVANAAGVSAARSDGTYNPAGEERIETGLAAILMALLAVVFYFTCRSVLPVRWSVLITIAGALGTQVWSVASRGLWSHTWETFLAGIVVYILLSSEMGKRKLNGIVLASVLAWMYFVRPSASVLVVAVSCYVFVYQREAFLRYLVTGGFWFAGFLVYSWSHFGKPLPSYYSATRLRFDLFPIALAGNLVSPSRGLLVYVPVILFIVYLLARYRETLVARRLVWLSLIIIGLHLVLTSSFANLWGDWWGGASYGPRYMTELVPWFMLLAILCVKAMTRWREQHPQRLPGKVFETATAVLLLALSVFINARGALSLDTWKWSQPFTDKQLRAQLWDYRHPQFLAGLQLPAPPTEFPLIEAGRRIDFGTAAADKYLWYGWSGAESGFRWSDGRKASFVFALNEARDLILQINMEPFLAPDLQEQTVVLRLNDESVETFHLVDGQTMVYETMLPRRLLATHNVITFELPNAASPISLKIGKDTRVLGIRIAWLEFQDKK